jgi:signal peptidase I
MAPTLTDGDRVLVIPARKPVRRGDMVVLATAEKPDQAFILRVIALSGEKVMVRNGTVLINGAVLNEPYVTSTSELAQFGETEVPPGHLVVMRDNRRDWAADAWGIVPEFSVRGRIVGH